MDGQVIIPAPLGSDPYVELSARTRQGVGVQFRKHILNLGTLIHPKTKEKLTLDEAWFDRVKRNFDAGTCDIVQVPLANDNNQHVEDPLRNAGEVIGLERDGRKVYSIVDIRRPDVVEGLRNKTILGASAFLNLDYENTDTGTSAGPTLLHHCITNRPYVTGLDDYEEVIAASNAADNEEDVVILSTEEPEMPLTKEQLLAQLKEEHGVDVAALEAQVAAKPDMAQLTAALTAALSGTGADVKLTGTQDGSALQLSDVVGAVAELAQANVRLTQSVGDLHRQGAEREIDGYIKEGRVLPKWRAHFVELALSNRDALAVMLPDQPVVALNNAQGSQAHDNDGPAYGNIDDEVARLAAEHAKLHPANSARPGSVAARRRQG